MSRFVEPDDTDRWVKPRQDEKVSQVNSPEDVAMLPWKGNAAGDATNFQLVEDYIRREPDLYKRQLADVLASIIGMGEHTHVDPQYDPKDNVN